jgi:23S rRNA-/tRNA-specific pseudouridylate synthase
VRRCGALALWRLRPRTGRRHQLRQHVLHLQGGRRGLLGDEKYCGREPGARAAAAAAAAAAASAEGGGLMLHACELVIPAGTLGAQQGADIVVRDELPARVRAALRAHQVPARLLAEALA